MKNKFYIVVLICFLLSMGFILFNKWNIDIYMESTIPFPKDKIDLKMIIDNQIVFNDTLKQNLGGYPTHIASPLRIGYHTISVSSNQANIHKCEKFFLLFNNYILLYYVSDERNNNSTFILKKESGRFGFE